MKRPLRFHFHPHWLIYLTIFLFSLFLMQHTFRYRSGQMLIASKVWSDFAAHIPLIRSFSMGENIPPEYPTFPGEPIRYHYLFYFLVGYLEQTGFNIAFSLNSLSTIAFALLLGMIFKLTHLIWRSTAAGIIALWLFLCNGSLSFVEFFRQHPVNLNTLNNILTASKFSSFGPWDDSLVSAFWTLNIYTNQRHLAAGFTLCLLILYPAVRILLSEKPPTRTTLMVGLLLMLPLPFLNQAAFAATLIILVTLGVCNWRHQLLRYYLAAVVSGAIPGIITTLLQPSHVSFDPGYLAQTPQWLDLAGYWVANLGLYLILIPILLVYLKSPRRFIYLSFLPLFVLANLFRFSPDMINNHKFINIFLIGTAIFTAGFIIRLFHHSRPGRLLAPLLLVALTFSGIIDLFPILNDYYVTVDDLPQNETATWIASTTPPDSIFLTSSYLYNPASLAGRKIFTDYGYFNWSLGYNDSVRKQQLPLFFSPTRPMTDICSQLAITNIGYIWIDAGQGSIPDIDPHRSTLVTQNTPVFTSNKSDQIFAVSSICPNQNP